MGYFPPAFGKGGLAEVGNRPDSFGAMVFLSALGFFGSRPLRFCPLAIATIPPDIAEQCARRGRQFGALTARIPLKYHPAGAAVLSGKVHQAAPMQRQHSGLRALHT